MQDGTNTQRHGSIECNPLSILQAERLRIAADMNLRKEIKHGKTSLRRTLAHVLVLESLDALRYTERQDPLPSYSEVALEPHECSTSCSDSDSAVPSLEEDEELEMDDDASDYSSDDEPIFENGLDAGLALSRIPSNSRIHSTDKMLLRPELLDQTLSLDAHGWTELASDRHECGDDHSHVVASVVEVSSWDD